MLAAWGAATYAPKPSWDSAVLALAALLTATQSLSWPRLRGFSFVVSVVLLVGFALVLTSWLHPPAFQEELRRIAWHASLTFFLVTVWLEASAVRSLLEGHRALRAELERLRRYDETTEVLARQEFLERLEDVVTGMHRRGEKGVLLLLQVQVRRGPLREALLAALADILRTSVRARYDLVGRIADDTMAVALQNTERTGTFWVSLRIRTKLRTRLRSELGPPLRLSAYPLEGPWPDVAARLTGLGLDPTPGAGSGEGS